MYRAGAGAARIAAGPARTGWRIAEGLSGTARLRCEDRKQFLELHPVAVRTGRRLAFARQELEFRAAGAALILKKRHTVFYRRLPRRLSLRIAASALAFRALSALVGGIAVAYVPLAAFPQTTMFERPSAFWDQFTRYDAGWYYQIARYGYWFVPGGP